MSPGGHQVGPGRGPGGVFGLHHADESRGHLRRRWRYWCWRETSKRHGHSHLFKVSKALCPCVPAASSCTRVPVLVLALSLSLFRFVSTSPCFSTAAYVRPVKPGGKEITCSRHPNSMQEHSTRPANACPCGTCVEIDGGIWNHEPCPVRQCLAANNSLALDKPLAKIHPGSHVVVGLGSSLGSSSSPSSRSGAVPELLGFSQVSASKECSPKSLWRTSCAYRLKSPQVVGPRSRFIHAHVCATRAT